jgi:hypothetical protein
MVIFYINLKEKPGKIKNMLTRRRATSTWLLSADIAGVDRS